MQKLALVKSRQNDIPGSITNEERQFLLKKKKKVSDLKTLDQAPLEKTDEISPEEIEAKLKTREGISELYGNQLTDENIEIILQFSIISERKIIADLIARQNNSQERIEKLLAARGKGVQNVAEQRNKAKEALGIDGLTGAFNRKRFDKELEKQIAQSLRYKRNLSAIFVDADSFKKVNDTHGHKVGDKVLRKIVEILHANVRNDIDIVARYGGEEFVILLPDTDLKGAQQAAEKLREEIEKEFAKFQAGDVFLNLTASFGVAQFNKEDQEAFINDADKAMYVAKKGGRNQVAVCGEKN
jgi:diguanylate cyclase (GGDEF)-like protein